MKIKKWGHFLLSVWLVWVGLQQVAPAVKDMIPDPLPALVALAAGVLLLMDR